MFEEYQICPYTGLRSFTEEESLYFKGREDHIDQATEQLQRNKFLMLTGASGDGKSSLVYAGIVPNARAGFLKSKYTQWKVADFRPERTPFKNLCATLAKQLDIANPGTVEAELEHGFSALIDLYKNSTCFIDINSNEWQAADENQKATLKRGAANLIIIVDQFEEFFTNPENYHNGVPSMASNLLLNVLLETARIALEEDLPIYIVFTMRSDYIGQCAAFRSLPEYIGFSQFFVPRLNRSQLAQVIEEPATLSGNKITRRLTERLIHDIAEGVDQLPILQHALNQIWHAADRGKEEMDLIHYAMVGGIASKDLPDDQVERFTKWFSKLPSKIKACYHEPSLENVLDAHANKLYESAAENYRIKTGNTIPDELAKQIIKTAFICLTKIDQSRAVRNRMTLKEICSILNEKEVDVAMAGTLLNIFREPGNTFIRPFITEEQKTLKLDEDAVLDITHESLIRNWAFLEEWANEEFDNYTISLDFEQQLNRWVDSGKSSGFLLSIGPLTYFETWYNNVNPNPWWIARYLPEDVDQSVKLEKAESVLSNTKLFLKKSARKHAITRAVMHYGAGKIAASLAIIALITLSSFAVRNYFRQQNDYVLKTIKEQTLALANSPKVDFFGKSRLLAEALKSGNTSIHEIVENVNDSLIQINTITRLSGLLVTQGMGNPKKEIAESFKAADSLLQQYPIEINDSKKLGTLIKEVNYLSAALELSYLYNPTETIDDLRKRNAERSSSIIKHILKVQHVGFKEIRPMNMAIENAINNKALSSNDIKILIEILSPFQKEPRSSWVLKSYEEDVLDVRSRNSYGFKFNGLYQQLASLYAAQGNIDRTLQCIDSLLKYNQSYFQNDYTAMADNAANISAVLYRYNHMELFDQFVIGYCKRKKMTEVDFYQRLIGRSNEHLNATENLNDFGGSFNLNVAYGSIEQLNYFFLQYRRSIERTVYDLNAKNFHMALSWKDEAILRSMRFEFTGQDDVQSKVSALFDKAIEYYARVDDSYLNQEIMAAKFSETDAFSVARKFLFLYPDYRTPFNPSEPRQFYFYHSSQSFIEYLLDNHLFEKLYTNSEMNYASMWIESYFINMAFKAFSVRMNVDPNLLIRLEEHISQRNVSLPELNTLYLKIGNDAYKRGDMPVANRYFTKIDISTLKNFTNTSFWLLKRESFNEIAKAITGLVDLDRFDDAYAIIRVFKNPINRSSLYAFAAKELLRKKNSGNKVQPLIDSARIELGRIENLSTGQPNRILIAYAMAMQDPVRNSDEAYKTVKNINNKFGPSLRISRSFAFHGDLFGAHQNIIGNLSDGDQAEFLWNILYGYSDNGVIHEEWAELTDNYFWWINHFITYVDEDN